MEFQQNKDHQCQALHVPITVEMRIEQVYVTMETNNIIYDIICM